MGLITGLLTLPLAPVRGTAWIAEKLLEQAELELDPDERLRRRLESLRVAFELGEITEADYEQAEQELLAEHELRSAVPAGPEREVNL